MIKNTGQPKAAFFLLAILFLSGLLVFLSLQDGHDWGGDFALYLRQARSLLNGTSEELLEFNRFAMEQSSVGPPSNPQIGPYLYPWGLPLLIAPVVAISGYALTPLKIYLAVYFLLSLGVCYKLFSPRIGKVNSLWLVAILAVNPFLLDFSNIINSDIPFLFFALISILFIEKSLKIRPYFFSKSVTYLLTGAFIFFSFLVRSNGILLVGVLGLGQLIVWHKSIRENFIGFLKKEWQELIPYGSFLLCWIIFGAVLTDGSGSHLTFLKSITPGKIYYNLLYYIELPAEFYAGIIFPVLLYGISLPFFALGVVKRWYNMPDSLYLIYGISSMFLFVLWPPVQGLRFIFSLLPFYLYFIFAGLLAAESQLGPGKMVRRQLSWVAAFSIVVLVLFMNRNVKNIYEIHRNYPHKKLIDGPYTQASEEVFNYLRNNTEKDDVVLFFKPRVLSFFTERQSLRIITMNEVKERKGNYLLYYKEVDFAQIPRKDYLDLRQHSEPVLENEDFALFNLNHSGGE